MIFRVWVDSLESNIGLPLIDLTTRYIWAWTLDFVNIFILILPVVVHHINKGGGPLCVLQIDVVDVSIVHDHMVLR